MKSSPSVIADLEMRLDAAAKTLAFVDGKKMFGCHALWAKGNVFAMVWKEGRIAVKLPDEKDYARLIALKGSGPWKAGPKVFAHWVLVPAELAEDKPGLRRWVARAHELALAGDAPAPKKKKKS